MGSRYGLLNPFALAVSFAVTGLIISIASVLPAALHLFGMHGAWGMMGDRRYGMGYAVGYGWGFAMLAWVVIIGAVAGALVAFVYNTVAGREDSGNLPLS